MAKYPGQALNLKRVKIGKFRDHASELMHDLTVVTSDRAIRKSGRRPHALVTARRICRSVFT
jgi:hypothetical protein